MPGFSNYFFENDELKRFRNRLQNVKVENSFNLSEENSNEVDNDDLSSDIQDELNRFYKLSSSRRNKRTDYNKNFYKDVDLNPLYDKPRLIINNEHSPFQAHELNMREERVEKGWFNQPCNQFNPNDRSSLLVKRKSQSFYDRFRANRLSQELSTSNKQSSVEIIENMAKRNSELVKSFKVKLK